MRKPTENETSMYTSNYPRGSQGGSHVRETKRTVESRSEAPKRNSTPYRNMPNVRAERSVSDINFEETDGEQSSRREKSSRSRVSKSKSKRR